jgi:hypothetical protein
MTAQRVVTVHMSVNPLSPPHLHSARIGISRVVEESIVEVRTTS